jgi:hypothetical protein
MTREALEEKALRYIREGRLRVVLVEGRRIEARVRGTRAAYVVGYEPGGWHCSCEAHRFGRRCAHLAALQLVTVRPARTRTTARRTTV